MKTQIIKIPLPGKGFKRFYLSVLIIVGLYAAAILNSALLVLPSNTTRTVYSTADSGAGSLREVLGNASSGDSILFDQSIFPPDNPATISLNSVLPRLNQGNLIIDASNAGVILNGRKISTSETVGIYVFSDNNIKKELLPLIKLEGIGRIRARVLFNSGFKTIKDLKMAPLEKIVGLPLIGSKLAKRIKEQIGGFVKQKEWKKLKEKESLEQQALTKY